ncbi:helix-turn-helix domain-containing protein [Turneriella parva]|uniref:Transcriptional regulator, AraC family n=1 Tax=Turneriella parva (strain ATCC BAA-1111 / DSM 21527 / NCTC 11395 / H) TaxID=869212 RepID=I4B380_TURPD|nr:helix-turn-helix domain-containing protein [Turneriella parva]AFM11737.1 transcriptional regulator, AraC family [Turneriella parva DSM 21527]
MNAYLTMLLFASGVCLLIALGQLFLARTGKKKYIWAAAYFFVGLCFVFAYLVHSDRLLEYPHIYGPHLVIIFLPAMMYYFYFRFWLYPDLPLRTYWHLIPASIAFVIAAPFLLENEQAKQAAIISYYKNGVFSWREYLFEIGLLSNVIYSGLLTWEARVLHKHIHVAGRSIFVLTALCAAISVVSVLIIMIAYAIGDRVLESYGMVGLVVAAAFGYFFMQRSSHISEELSASVEQERYRKTRLNGVDLNKIRQGLRELMDEQKLYTDFDLSLAQLAEALGLNAHQLSEYLNIHEKKKFSDYIGEFRIHEAKRLLVDEGGENLLRAGLAAGFSSKSSFNSLFKKATGLTPGEYRDQFKKRG